MSCIWLFSVCVLFLFHLELTFTNYIYIFNVWTMCKKLKSNADLERALIEKVRA